MGILSGITRGKISKPHLVLIYAVDKWGKSTMASEAPSPLFIGAEEGTNNIDVARYEPHTLDDVRAKLGELVSEQHEFKSVVIDTVDWLTPMVELEAIARWNSHESKKCKGIDEPGFGKGRVLAFEIWRNFLPLLSAVRDHGINVILLAHAIVQKFDDPTQAQSYDRYSLKLQGGLKTDVAGLLREYVDSVLFGNYDTSVVEKEKHRAFGEGNRVLFTERRPGFEAGNRFNLPFEIPMVRGKMWSEYAKYVEAAPERAEDASVIIEQIQALLPRVKQAELVPKIQAKFEKAGQDVPKLQAVLKGINELVGVKG